MKSTVLFFFTLILLFSQQAHARIGETLHECNKRYGAHLESIDSVYAFNKNGYIILVNIYKNKADMIGYQKLETNSLDMAEELSDNEIHTLLEANSNGEIWIESNDLSFHKNWATEDGAMFAIYNTMENTLMIVTKEYVDRANEARKMEENKNLNGF